MEFPKFEGGDPRGWILKAEKYFRYYQTPDNHKVNVAAIYLEGDALDLFAWINSEQTLLYWEELKKALQENYGPAEFQNPDEHLCNIRRTGTVHEYRQEFAKRAACVKNWPEHCLLGVFLSGLKEELKTDVRIHKPRTVYQAMSLALEFEAKTSTTRGLKVPSWSSSAKPNAVWSFSRPPGTRDLPLLHLAAPANSRAPFTPNPLAPLPTQSRQWDAERQARLAKGLCFRCNEKFQPGHKCKPSSLSLLEITEDESPEHEDAEGNLDNDAADAELAEINFHAILGYPVGATLKLQGKSKRGKS